MIRRPPRSTPLSLHDALPIYQSNGHSVFGITTTILGVNAGIDLADTTLTGSSIDLEAFAGTLNTTVDRKSTRLNSSHQIISYAVFCLKKKKSRHARRTSRDAL